MFVQNSFAEISNKFTYLSHQILKLWCNQQDKKFKRKMNALEATQRDILSQILNNSNLVNDHQVYDYSTFIKDFKITRYADWKESILKSKKNQQKLAKSKMVRYQPTSGSSEQIKFIPYTQMFLDELDSAIAPWLSSIYRKSPELVQGTHYWSVSWLPESQREVLKDDNLNDDSALLGFGKRMLSKFTQAVSGDISFAAQADDAMFATLCYLVADKNLAMISVWSPTFALQLLEKLETSKDEVFQVLHHGNWGTRSESLKLMKVPKNKQRAKDLKRSLSTQGINFEKLWPKLKLVSSWDTAGSRQWAQALKDKLPFAQFEGKGLWATEGVVTIPYDGDYPLAYQSHFYEFEYLAGKQIGQIIPSWKLKLGDLVSPIISSGNGLLRYAMDDSLLVTGFKGEIPCFEFQGRRFGVDLVGEKLSPDVAEQLLKQLSTNDLKAIALLAIDTGMVEKPFYTVLFEGAVPAQFDVDKIDRLLRANFHYDLARDLGQLNPASFICKDDGWLAYKTLVMRDGMIEGNIKPEPLKKISLESLKLLV